MKEDFLQLVWLHQFLERGKPWITTSGNVQVLKPGFRNRNQAGPDFEQAKIKIGEVEWAGSVEIHVRASEWNQHGHHFDPRYNSVVLHVVWENNAQTFREDGTLVPTLEIQGIINLQVLLQYRRIMAQNELKRPCSGFISTILPLNMIVMQERVLVERLERKANLILGWLKENQHDWLETFYQSIAHNLGLKSNHENLKTLANAIPLKILASQNWKPEQLIPIYLGMAGILNKNESAWLEKEFQFFRHKFNLEKPILTWNRFRVREASRPEHRILQLALLASRIPDWFKRISNLENPHDFFREIKNLEPEDELRSLLNENGISMGHTKISFFIFESLIINTFAPFLVAMGLHFEKKEWIETAIQWLASVKPEKNKIISDWKNSGILPETAAETQALIELNNSYCAQKRCLECAIGISYIKMEGNSIQSHQ